MHLVRKDRERETNDVYDTVLVSTLFSTVILCVGRISRAIAWALVLPALVMYVCGRVYRSARAS